VTTDRTVVLAVDAACERCRAVGAVAARASPGLEVLPLRDYRVAAWRAEAGDPPWAPTLLVVEHAEDGDEVRAWHGPRLVPGLLAVLGPRRAWVLARALRAAGLAPEVARGVLRPADRSGIRRPWPGRGA
jgi:hypothetical protein